MRIRTAVAGLAPLGLLVAGILLATGGSTPPGSPPARDLSEAPPQPESVDEIALLDDMGHILDDAVADMLAGGRASLPELRTKLRDEDDDVRLAALVVLGEMGPANRPLSADVSGLVLHDESEFVRLLAGKVLERMGADVPAVLGRALGSDDPEVRLRAIRAFGWIGRATPPDVRRLAPFLDSTAEPECRAALDALDRIGGPAATEALGLCAKSHRLERFRVEAIRRLGDSGEPSAVPILREVLRSAPGAECTNAARALGKLGPVARPAVDDLVGVLQRQGGPWTAVEALGRIGGKRAYGELLRILREVPEHRLVAIVALRGWGASAAEAVPDLARFLDHVRIGGPAAETLAAVGGDSVIGLLTERLGRAEDAALRRNAALGLGHLGSRAAGAVPALVLALADPEVSVREAAALALFAVGPAARDARGELERIRDDASESSHLRWLARQALDRIRAER